MCEVSPLVWNCSCASAVIQLILELCSEAVAIMIFILFLIYCTRLGTGFEIKSIFCSISESCECDYKPDIKGKVCMILLTAVSSAYKQLALASVVLLRRVASFSRGN